MKFLIDTNPPKIQRWVEELPDFVAGQLIVPASTRRNWGGVYAMDNSAFISFDKAKFLRLQANMEIHFDKCLFVTCPDIVGDARRTMEIWKRRKQFANGFKLTLVAQDGLEDMDIPWDETDAIFIGGRDPWKDSQCCLDIVRTAKILGKHVHCGRVNQIKRFKLFSEVNCDTCDGSSIALHDYKLRAIAAEFNRVEPDLFQGQEDD